MVVPLKSLYRSLQIYSVSITPRRVWNLIKVYSSMILSRLLRRPIVWGIPPLLMVEPTNICNLKCPMCPSGNGEMQRSRGKLDLSNFKKLIDEVGDDILQIQLWNQGEPFINKDFLEFVRYAKQKGIMTLTSTNGHYIRSDEMAEAVVRSGLDQLIFSMDGTNPETYAKYRVGGNFHLVIETLGRISRAKQRLQSKTPLIELQFIVFKHNQDEINELIRICQKYQVNRVSFKTAQVYNSEQAEAFLPEDEKFNRYEKKENELELKGEIKNWCKRLWLNPAVNWDGSVSPCCFDKDAEFAYDNIFLNGTSFRHTWKNGKATAFRKQILRDRKAIDMCRNCTEGLKEPYTQIVELSDLENTRSGKNYIIY